jgi:subtilisin family serine protease
MTGTSMSVPHVAGAAALYLETHPGATPADVTNAVKSTGDFGPDHKSRHRNRKSDAFQPNDSLYSRTDANSYANTHSYANTCSNAYSNPNSWPVYRV